MKGRNIAAAVLAVLVVLGGLFLLSRDGTEDQTSPETPAENEVGEMSDIETNTATRTNEMSTSTPSENSSDESAEAPEGGEEPTSNNTGVDEGEERVEAEDEVSTNESNEVLYTSSGFSPKTLEIAQGDTVTFVNNSSGNMWVASNFHPTHNEYPTESEDDCAGSSFDACIGVEPGETWSFTFERIGEWGYHNHINPSRTGTIVVN